MFSEERFKGVLEVYEGLKWSGFVVFDLELWFMKFLGVILMVYIVLGMLYVIVSGFLFLLIFLCILEILIFGSIF